MVQKIISVGFIVVFSIISGSSLQAQMGSANTIAETMTSHMDYLNLTENQRNKVMYLNKVAADALNTLDQKVGDNSNIVNNKAITSELIGIMVQRDRSLKALLTPDQMNLFSKNRIKELASFRTLVMTTLLDLTDEQIPQAYAINLKSVEAMQKDLDERSKSKKVTNEQDARRIIANQFKNSDKDFEAILSPSQLMIYKNNEQLLIDAVRHDKKVEAS